MNPINPIDTSQIQAMMQKLKTMAAQTESPSLQPVAPEENAQHLDFGNVLKASLDKVNEAQQTASQLGERFAKGDDSVNLADVMIAGQKAGIALQTTIQVRSRLVSAYNDIMNMQV